MFTTIIITYITLLRVFHIQMHFCSQIVLIFYKLESFKCISLIQYGFHVNYDITHRNNINSNRIEEIYKRLVNPNPSINVFY